MDIRNIFGNITSTGSAIGQELLDTAVGSIRYGIKNLEPKDCFPRFGDLKDVVTNKGNGICLDGIHCAKESIGSVALLSPTGGGKTQVCMLNTLSRMNGPSIIVFDPSSTIAPLVMPRFHKLGYEQHIIDYSNILNSASFNHFDCLSCDDDCYRLASHFSHVAHEGSKGDVFFVESAASQCAFYMKLLLRADKKYRNFSNLLRLVEASSVPKKLDKLAARLCTDSMWNEYVSLAKNQSEKTMASIQLSIKLMLKYWSSDAMARVTSVSSIDINSLRDRKQIIYINTSTYDAQFYQILNSTTIDLFLRSLMKEVKPNCRSVFLLIDEAATCNLPSLSSIISNIRKYNIRMLLCYQSLGQIYSAYNQGEAENILSNVSTLFYSAQDFKTAKQLSELFGSVRSTNVSGRTSNKPLMETHDITHMGKHNGLFVHRNVPYKLNLVPWYKQHVLKAQMAGNLVIFSNPHIPSKVELISFE